MLRYSKRNSLIVVMSLIALVSCNDVKNSGSFKRSNSSVSAYISNKPASIVPPSIEEQLESFRSELKVHDVEVKKAQNNLSRAVKEAKEKYGNNAKYGNIRQYYGYKLANEELKKIRKKRKKVIDRLESHEYDLIKKNKKDRYGFFKQISQIANSYIDPYENFDKQIRKERKAYAKRSGRYLGVIKKEHMPSYNKKNEIKHAGLFWKSSLNRFETRLGLKDEKLKQKLTELYTAYDRLDQKTKEVDTEKTKLSKLVTHRDQTREKLFEEQLAAVTVSTDKDAWLSKVAVYRQYNKTPPYKLGIKYYQWQMDQLKSKPASYAIGLIEELKENNVFGREKLKLVINEINQSVFLRIIKESGNKNNFKDAMLQMSILKRYWDKSGNDSKGWASKAVQVFRKQGNSADYHLRQAKKSKYKWTRYYHLRMAADKSDGKLPLFPSFKSEIVYSGKNYSSCLQGLSMLPAFFDLKVVINYRDCRKEDIIVNVVTKKAITKRVPITESRTVYESTQTSGFIPQMGQTSICTEKYSDGRCKSSATVTAPSRSGSSSNVFTGVSSEDVIVGYKDKVVGYENISTPTNKGFKVNFRGNISAHSDSLSFSQSFQSSDRSETYNNRLMKQKLRSALDGIYTKRTRSSVDKLKSLPETDIDQKTAIATELMMMSRYIKGKSAWGESNYLFSDFLSIDKAFKYKNLEEGVSKARKAKGKLPDTPTTVPSYKKYQSLISKHDSLARTISIKNNGVNELTTNVNLMKKEISKLESSIRYNR